MRLTHFRVTKFRNILDTGEVSVDDLVTCLVGMNEAGKSALLAALNRLNPADGAGFNIQQDYPRWKKQRDIRDGLIDDAVPISGGFAVEATDVAAVEAVLGPDVLAAGTLVVVERRYGSPEKLWRFAINEQACVRNLVARADVAPDLRAAFEEADTLVEFDARLDALSAEEQVPSLCRAAVRLSMSADRAWSPASLAFYEQNPRQRVDRPRRPSQLLA